MPVFSVVSVKGAGGGVGVVSGDIFGADADVSAIKGGHRDGVGGVC